MKTTKEQINEVIKSLENTAKTCEISTVAEIKNNLKSAISNLQAVEAETASGDTLLRQRIAELSNALGLVEDTTDAAVGSLAYEIRKRIDKLLHVCPVEPCNPAALDETTAAMKFNNEELAAHNARMDEVLAQLEKQTAATSDGDKSLNSTNYKVLFIFNRICALKAEKQQIAETMGAKWLSSNIADEYNNTIYGLLEEIEKLAGADAERK